MHRDGVFIGRNQVGVVTSGTRSPILKKAIALARLDVTPDRRVAGGQLSVYPGKIQRCGDPAHQMIVRHNLG